MKRIEEMVDQRVNAKLSTLGVETKGGPKGATVEHEPEPQPPAEQSEGGRRRRPW